MPPAPPTDQLQIVPGVDIDLSGDGVDTQKIYLDRAGLIAAMTDVENHTGQLAGSDLYA